MCQRAQTQERTPTGEVIFHAGDDGILCDDIPVALFKACADEFAYAMGVRSGQVLWFESAQLSPDHQWVHLTPLRGALHKGHVVSGIAAPFERGIDVRVADIVWVADAPYGS